MNKKRINELANFFFSSDSAKNVPLRIAITTGQFSGFDLDKQNLKNLLYLLENSENLKEDLKNFGDNNYFAPI